KVDIPSYSVKEGDAVTVLGRTQKNPTIAHAMEAGKGRGIPEGLSVGANTISGRVNSMPTREQINLPVQEQLIVELYSKYLPAASFQLPAKGGFFSPWSSWV